MYGESFGLLWLKKKMETNQKFHLGSVVRLELDLIRVVNAKIDWLPVSVLNSPQLEGCIWAVIVVRGTSGVADISDRLWWLAFLGNQILWLSANVSSAIRYIYHLSQTYHFQLAIKEEEKGGERERFHTCRLNRSFSSINCIPCMIHEFK